VGLTWRAGLARGGKIVLAKAIDPAELAAALSGTRATFISLQRESAEGRRSASPKPSAPRSTMRAVNDRLEDAAAMVEVLDDYIAVSNTNVHLRASAGRSGVLVPWPPEWRWLAAGERLAVVSRDAALPAIVRGDWQAALARLREDLSKP
jgi:hypothetical protein